jgi:hypothetical protein
MPGGGKEGPIGPILLAVVSFDFPIGSPLLPDDSPEPEPPVALATLSLAASRAFASVEVPL